ncbi:MAG: tetraacyldisaccharide 4'-kinase [Rudaea sp.]
MFDEQKLLPIWYGDASPGFGLRALSALFGALVAMRRGLYRLGILRSFRLPVPVVVVGNISVGGTGKTPLTIALVEALRERGFSPGVVSRGYSGSAAGSQILDANPDPVIVGDEPVVVARATGAPVAIGSDRVSAARLLLARGVDVIIADDGLQHYRLRRNVEICVIDGARRFGNARLLPAGPLREPVARLGNVDFRVCNGVNAGAGEVPMQLVGDSAVNIGDPQRQRALLDFSGQRVHAVAGIGNPQRFFSRLRAYGIDLVEHAFADHHAYCADDLSFGDDAAVLMTQKDAVKCVAFARASWWYVPVAAKLPPEFLDAVAGRLRWHRSARSRYSADS